MTANEPITNELGEIAIRYYQPAQVLVKNTPTGNQYFFNVKRGVSMAWVDPKDAEDIISRRSAPCCHKKRFVYSYANQEAVNLWMR